jgi:hypothetical protein
MRMVGLFGVLLVVLVPLQAGVVVGTADPSTGNCFPFGCTTGNIFQQVYAPSDFSGTIDITSLSFFRTQYGSSTDTINSATYTIKLSYSAHAVDALDTTTFSNNVGSGQVTFGTYVLSGVMAGSGLTFVENNSDFVYNPATGPLLVEIDLSGVGAQGTTFLDAMNGDAGGLFSRAQNFGGGFSDWGLVTGFDVGAAGTVPEPATLALSGGGLLVIALLRRRRNRRNAVPSHV